MSFRHTSVAGSWYSDDPARLTADVDRYVGRAEFDPIAGSILALVAPHAGLIYSGPVAAFAYKAAARAVCDAIVLVGPSHFVPFRGVSIWPDGTWETPFGPVNIDRDLARAIQAASPDVMELPAAHGREH